MLTVCSVLVGSAQEETSGDRALANLRKPVAEVIPLWPGQGTRQDDPTPALRENLPQRGDGLVRITNVSRPTIHIWRAEKPDARAVVVLPGGGYNGLAAQHEGTEIAQWLNGQGITAFVVKYRVPRREGLEKHAVALQDAQRAIRLVRAGAKRWKIDPDQLGVLGFSAGGHLTALTVHQAETQSYAPLDQTDQVSARPNFAVLIYPAYLTQQRQGPDLDPLVTELDRDHFPPVFLAVAADDSFAPGSLYYALHLQSNRLPVELHVFPRGGHGKGLQQRGYPFSQWTKSCERWLADLRKP